MNKLNNSVSLSFRSCDDKEVCKKCNELFSIISLHDGLCFDCRVDIFKAAELKKLGFDYVLPILAQEVSE